MAYTFNKEPIYQVEIIGMVLCFIAVVFITISEQNQEEILQAQEGLAEDQ